VQGSASKVSITRAGHRAAGAPQGCRLQLLWPPVTLTKESAASSHRRAVRDILLYGVCGGLLIAVLQEVARA
jgi:hypothetical protein